MNGYHSVLSSASFLRGLLDLDSRTRARVQAGRCPHCRGRLDSAPYPRKPRGIPQAFEEEFSVRQSLCCAAEGCRKRTTPPSVCFLWRRVYVAVSFILLSMLRHGVTEDREQQLHRAFHGEFPADARTLSRWREWWQHILPVSPFWRGERGLLRTPVSPADLPAGLVESFTGELADKLTSALGLLSPLSTSSCRSCSGTAMAA